jgi:hypothetical protein
MIGARLIIDGREQVPDALSTPAGRPDTSTETQVAANSQLLWRALRETIRHANGAALPDRRDDIGGLLWRGNPFLVARTMWDGMDDTEITVGVMDQLYEHLRLTRHLLRVDEGSQGRKWWVADEWDDTRVPTAEHPFDPFSRDEPRTVALAPADVVLLGEPAAAVIIDSPAPDPHAAIQAILDENTALTAENRQLKSTISITADTAALAAENQALRSQLEEFRANNTRLRRRVAAYEITLGTQADDELP